VIVGLVIVGLGQGALVNLLFNVLVTRPRALMLDRFATRIRQECV
jgi:hypothetical protein